MSDGEQTDARAAVRALLEASGALRVAAVVDLGEESSPALVEETGDGTGAPPLRADAATGEVSTAFGVLEDLAIGVLELARSLGGRSAAIATYPTEDPGLPLTISARQGEPLLIVIGEREFRAPAGWPPAAT